MEIRDFECGRRVDFKTQNRNRKSVTFYVRWNGGGNVRKQQRRNYNLAKRKQRLSATSNRKLTLFFNFQ